MAGSESGLFPLHGSRGDVDALHRSVAVFFELEHAEEVAVFQHGRRPVVGQWLVASKTVGLGGRPLRSVLGHLGRSSTHAVTGRAVHQVTGDDRGGRRGDLVGEVVTPELGAGLGIYRDQSRLEEPDDLTHAMNCGQDRGGMGDLLVTGLPDNCAALYVQGHQAFASATASHEDSAIFNHR